MIEVVYSTGRLVMKEVLQRSVLGPLLFNIFINDLEEVTECLLARFAGDSKLGGTTDILKSRTDIQSSLDTEGMVQWEPYVIKEGLMRNPAPGKGEFLAIVQAGTTWLGLICGRGPEGW